MVNMLKQENKDNFLEVGRARQARKPNKAMTSLNEAIQIGIKELMR